MKMIILCRLALCGVVRNQSTPFPDKEISPSRQGTPKQAQSNAFIAHICGCSGVTHLCNYNINGVLFSLPMFSSLIPNATVEIRSMIHAYLFSGSGRGNGQKSFNFSLKSFLSSKCQIHHQCHHLHPENCYHPVPV